MYYIYMLRCSDNSLYTGITTDFKKRFETHMSKGRIAAKYTKSHRVVSVEALWTSPDRSTATRLECYIKGLKKQKKEELIKNPELVNSLGLETEYIVIKSLA